MAKKLCSSGIRSGAEQRSHQGTWRGRPVGAGRKICLLHPEIVSAVLCCDCDMWTGTTAIWGNAERHHISPRHLEHHWLGHRMRERPGTAPAANQLLSSCHEGRLQGRQWQHAVHMVACDLQGGQRSFEEFA